MAVKSYGRLMVIPLEQFRQSDEIHQFVEMHVNRSDNFSCIYSPMEYLELKFVLVGIIGTSIAVVGMVTNSLAIVTLKPSINFLSPSPLIYLFVIGILDFFFMWIYILVLSIEIYFDYFDCLTLYNWWNWYLPKLLVTGKIIQTASTFLLVSASVERFLDVGGFGCGILLSFGNYHRWLVMLTVFMISFLFRGVSFWELEIVKIPECTGFARFKVGLTTFSRTSVYKSYCFYGVNIFHIILPFIVLILFNCAIVYRMRKAIRSQREMFGRTSVWECSRKEKNLLIATKMLISAVVFYLIANVLSFFITFMEHTNYNFLTQYPKFYTLSVDFIGLLQVTTSAARLLICTILSDKLRRVLCGLMRKRGYSTRFS